VNEPDETSRLIALGIDAFTTRVPGKLLALLGRWRDGA